MCDPTTIAVIGLGMNAGGKLAQGIAGKKAGEENARLTHEQMATEAQLTAIQDTRLREKMRGQIEKQRLQLAGRGVNLSSPSSVFLGQKAAEELSYASQSLRSRGAARQAELAASARAARAKGNLALLTGTLGAAGAVVTAAPDIWPGLYDQGGTNG